MNIKSILTFALAVPALAVVGQTQAMATARPNVPSAIVAPQAAKANCGNARVCAFIRQGGGITRAKNVSKVTNPSSGVYCITPKSGVVTLSQVTPLTTVEWGSSAGNNLLALYSDSKLNCPSSALEVHTFDGQGNADNFVSFFIVVN